MTGTVLLCAAACLASVADDAPVPRPPAQVLPPRTSITSGDDTIEVFADSDHRGFRWPVMTFASQFRKEFLRVTRLEFGRPEHPISIGLGRSTNDWRAISSLASDFAGGVREWIEIPDPDHVDLDLLRTLLAQALVREWERAHPPASSRMPPQNPPAWLLAGLARQISVAHRLEDLDMVHAQWLHCRLPPLVELLSAQPPVALQHPALPAVLVTWLLEHPSEPFGALLRRLADGTPWSPVLVAEVLQEQRNITALDEDWDAWQSTVLHQVRQTGVTTPGTVVAFRSQLLLYPGDYDLPFNEPWRGRSFAECLTWVMTPTLQQALINKAGEIRIFAAGRDGALQQTAADYAAVFEMFANGGMPARARALLAQAEEARRQLETRVAKGEMLHDPVAEVHAGADRSIVK